MSPANLPPLLTVDEARRTLLRGIGRNQVYASLRAGELPAIRIGRSWRICRDPLLRMLGADPPNGDSPAVGAGLSESSHAGDVDRGGS